MDPQLAEYRRNQRARAAGEAKKAGGGKQSWIVIAAVISAAGLVAVVHTQNSPAGTAIAGGICPKADGIGICVEECSKHEDCQSKGQMCCSNGCGHVCTDPVAPGQQASSPSRKCTLMVTLADKDAADDVLQVVPAPTKHSHLSAVGIVILEYAAGQSSDCCAAEQALKGRPSVKFVEYDGAKPACALESSESGEDMNFGIVHDGPGFIQEEEEPLMGGVSSNGAVDEESMAVWEQVLEKNPVHENHDLKSFGKPVSVKTQVVAGTNYYFSFASGGVATVFHQPWSETLEVSDVRA